jgi:hypothetical protein
MGHSDVNLFPLSTTRQNTFKKAPYQNHLQSDAYNSLKLQLMHTTAYKTLNISVNFVEVNQWSRL